MKSLTPPNSIRKLNSCDKNIVVLIGENGAGKSILLNELAATCQRNGKKVIAISNSIYSKFKRLNKNFEILAFSRGKRTPLYILKRAIFLSRRKGLSKLRAIGRALSYANYIPAVEIDIVISKNYNRALENLAERKYSKDVTQRLEEIITFLEPDSAFLLNWNLQYKRGYNSITLTLPIDFEASTFLESIQSDFLSLFELEKELRDIGFLKEIDIFLLKKVHDRIPLGGASSGELSILCFHAFLSASLDSNETVLIDEPENSLHPQWQKDYVQMLMDQFSLMDPKFVIATHSPIIVSGATLESGEKLQVFKVKDFELIDLDHSATNLEDMLWSDFDLITPKSDFLADYLVELLNKVAETDFSVDEFVAETNKLKGAVYDESQLEILDGAVGLAKRISESPSGGGG